MAVARQGRLEEEIYLTSFLWEEAKHTEFFRRWLDEVPRIAGQDLHEYIGPNYRTLFFEELPGAMGRLLNDQSNEALARALTTYNMMIEGVLAETGYHSYSKLLEAGRLFPGLAGALKLISRDETRHIRFGVYMLQLLIQQDGAMWDVVQRRMEELMPIVLGIVGPPPPEEGQIPDESVFAADPDEMTRLRDDPVPAPDARPRTGAGPEPGRAQRGGLRGADRGVLRELGRLRGLAAQLVVDDLRPALHLQVVHPHLLQRQQLAGELVGLLDRDLGRGSLDQEGQRQVDLRNRRRVVVDQAEQRRLDLARVLDLLLELPPQTVADRVAVLEVARVDVAADAERVELP